MIKQQSKWQIVVELLDPGGTAVMWEAWPVSEPRSGLSYEQLTQYVHNAVLDHIKGGGE